METFREFFSGRFETVPIDLENPNWHAKANIPGKPGWYYITTSAPIEELALQQLWDKTYVTKTSNQSAKVKNYDLSVRCARYFKEPSDFWNVKQVYSGLANNLRNRAREHTFADPGTAGLALSKYPDLFEFEWSFSYRKLDDFLPDFGSTEPYLHLGEQIWRSIYGWPVLCAE